MKMNKVCTSATVISALLTIFNGSAFAETQAAQPATQSGAAQPAGIQPPAIATASSPAAAVAAPAVPAAPATPVAAKSTASGCAPWGPTKSIDPKYLAKLEKNVASEKLKDGILYSQDRMILLFAKDHAAAKVALAHKDKIEQKDGKVDLRGVDLNGFNLSGLDLSNVDLKGAELHSANLAGTNLHGANLYKAEFVGANLNGADLSYTNSAKADFEQASLCETSLMVSDMEDAHVTWAYMKGAKLDRAMHVPELIYSNSEGVLQFGLPVPPIK